MIVSISISGPVSNLTFDTAGDVTAGRCSFLKKGGIFELDSVFVMTDFLID